MRTYEVEFNEGEDKGVYAVSLVENPAMEGMFIALKKDEPIKLAKVDEEQRILLGVALIPDKPILRLADDGEEFQIIFRKDTIKEAAHAFLKNQYNNNSSLEHEEKINGVSFVESWIIEDDKKDKSRAYGIEEPVGSWMVAMKVESDEIWNEYVKTGLVKGFSIDGLFSLKEIKLNSDKMSNNKKSSLATALKSIKEALGIEESDTLQLNEENTEEVKLGEAMLSDGKTKIVYEGEELAEGVAVFVVSGEDRVPAPEGSHELEDGKTIVVDSEGMVTSVEMYKEEKEETEEVEMSEDEVTIEVDANASREEIREALDKLDKMAAELSEVKKEIKDAKQENEKLKAELAKTPATEPLIHTDKKVKLSENSSLIERVRAAKSNNY